MVLVPRLGAHLVLIVTFCPRRSDLLQFPHEPVAYAAGSLFDRATAYAEAAFAEARRDENVSPAAQVEALDALQHSHRVATIMCGVARFFDCDQQQFGAAGVLHDIGKVAIEADGRRHIVETIAQPGGLTVDEKQLVDEHGPRGADLIDDQFGSDIAAATALHCTYDSEGLSFLEIALQGADIYDALRSPRVYKDGERHAKALLELMAQAPAVSDELLIFLALHGDLLWRDAWDAAPGMYGREPVQLSVGLAA